MACAGCRYAAVAGYAGLPATYRLQRGGPGDMVNASVPAGARSTAVLAATAHAAAVHLGGDPEVAALAVRLAADDAVRRTTVDRHNARVTLHADVVGTELELRIGDAGEPLASPPAEVLALVDMGVATSVHSAVEGTGNVIAVRVPLPAHDRLLDDSDLEVLADDAPAADATVEVRQLTADDAASLTRCLYRCYGWTYPGADLYYPDRIAAAIGDGRRIGEVAVDAHGEVVAHWGAVEVADGVVETGVTVTDPRFRKRGLAAQLGERLLARLEADGVAARMREPVLTHPATQRIALAEGATLVGFHLHAALPLRQVGITDGMLTERVSVSVMFSPLQPLEPATVWVPAVYEPFVRTVLDGSQWPREVGGVRRQADCPPASVVGSSYDALNRTGVVQVDRVGTDLIDAVDEALGGLQRAGAQMVMVRLPANQPALASVGAGLGSLSLGFASLLPVFGAMGDALVLQWLADPEVDQSAWVFANDDVEQFARRVAAHVAELGDQATRLRRRDAMRRQLLAALPGDDDSTTSPTGDGS